jgi:hypothetical protein
MKTKIIYLFLLISVYTYGQTFPTNELAGYYKFDSGNVLTDQAGASNLTQTGSNLIEITDRFDTASTNAVSLNEDYLSRADVGNVNTTGSNLAVSHSFWVKTSSSVTNVSEFIIGDSDRTNAGFGSTDYGYDILLRNGSIVIGGRFASINSFSSGGATQAGYTHTSIGSVNDDEWRHVAVVFYTTTGLYNGLPGRIYSNIYIDGILDSAHSFVAPTSWGRLTSMPFTTGNLVIGNNRNENLPAANKYKDGFDDYFVYNRVLSDTEVTTLATQDGYCFAPQNNILSVVGVTENAATVNISTAGTYDIAYAIQGSVFNGVANFNNVGSSVNLTGLDGSTHYDVYIREECAAGFESDWSAPISFRTLGQIYVDDTATGLNNGSSWANAYTDLKSAMDTDQAGQEIWVAGGIYKTQSQNSSFLIDKTNISLYGGFAGTETLLSQRVLGTNESVISGDINGDDDPNILYQIDATRSDNTRRLIVLNGTSDNFVIDGFTITAGMGTPARDGGGIYNVDADNVLVSNCKFLRNAATGRGGAILASPSNGGQMTIESCVFEENFSLHGGAIYQLASYQANLVQANTVNVNKSIFLNNMATGAGAAIFSDAYVNNCHFNADANEFVGNNARSGAIYATVQNNGSLNVSITNSLFNGNITEDNSIGTGNSGSAAWLRTIGAGSTLTSSIVNNTFVNNIDIGTSTGLNNFNRATLALTKDNASATHTATVSNNIFYNNETANGITSKSISGLNETLATVTVENSIDEDNFSLIASGSKTNTSNTDPQFTNAAGNDYTLGATTSPAVNSGNTNAVTTPLDLLGNARVYGTIVDMGAYEYQCSGNCFVVNVAVVGNGTVTQTGAFYNSGDNVTVTATAIAGSGFIGWTGDVVATTNPLIINNITSDYNITATFIQTPIYVDVNAGGNNDGTTWANAYTDLQDALAIVNVDDEIWIAKGTYNPVTPVTPAFPTILERQASFNINTEGVTMYGGFAGTETSISQRNIIANPTILTGDLNDDDQGVSITASYKSDNSYHIVNLNANNVIIDGFTIEKGHAYGTTLEYGGGILISDTSQNPTFKNCIFRENVGLTGGAIRVYFDTNSTITFEHCIFDNNLSRYGSGANILANNNRTVTANVFNCLFNANFSVDNGTSTSQRGYTGSSLWIRANGTGSNVTTNVTNCTFTNNVDSGTQGGSNRGTLALSRRTDVSSTHNATINNSIFYANRDGTSAVATKAVNSGHTLMPNLTFVNNSIDENSFSNLTSLANISNANPMFTDASNEDYTLQSGSPAIDTGNNSKIPAGINTDLLGNARILNATVDMGAYEYDSTLGINDSELNKTEIILYPNPTSSVLNIKTNSNLKRATIYSVLGKKILETSSKKITTSNLNKGIYLIKIETEDGSISTKRFMKE